MSVVRPFVLALTCTAVLTSVAPGQAGMLVGLTFERGKLEYGQGYAVAGTFTLRSTARLGMRFDFGVQTFSRSGGVNVAVAPCPLPPQPCGGGPPVGTSLTVVSTTARLVLTEHPRAKDSFYWLAGIGVYAVNDVPNDGAYTRLGWNGGGGIRIGSNIVAEIRYDGLCDPRGTRGFLPITFGFRF